MSTSEKRVKVFVYGTLMGGYPLHDSWMKNATKVEDRTILGFTLLDLGPYPALLEVVNSLTSERLPEFSVKGEVWEMSGKEFAALAAMEMRVGYTVEKLEDGTFLFLFETIGNNVNHWKKSGGIYYEDQIPF